MADEDFQIPLVWVGLDESPVLMANQFICQFQEQDEFVLSVGHVVTPPLLGTPEENEQMLRDMAFIGVKPLARFGMTEQGIRKMIEILQTNLTQYGNQRGRMDGP